MIKKYWLKTVVRGREEISWYYSEENRTAVIDRLPDDVPYSTMETEEVQ